MDGVKLQTSLKINLEKVESKIKTYLNVYGVCVKCTSFSFRKLSLFVIEKKDKEKFIKIKKLFFY